MRWFVRAFGGNARAPRDVDGALRSALLAVLDRNLDEAESLLTQAVRIDSTTMRNLSSCLISLMATSSTKKHSSRVIMSP